jgi:hypothetical protein
MLTDNFSLKIDHFWNEDFEKFNENFDKFFTEIPITISRYWILKKFCMEFYSIDDMCTDIMSTCNKSKYEIVEVLTDLLCECISGNKRIKPLLYKLLTDEYLIDKYETIIIDNIVYMDNYTKREFIIDELIKNAPCKILKEYCQYLDVLRCANYCKILQYSSYISLFEFFVKSSKEFEADDDLLTQIVQNDLMEISELFLASKKYEEDQPYDRLFYEYSSLILELELEISKHICSKMIPIVRSRIKHISLNDNNMYITYDFESYSSSEEYKWSVDFSEKELVSTLI